MNRRFFFTLALSTVSLVMPLQAAHASPHVPARTLFSSMKSRTTHASTAESSNRIHKHATEVSVNWSGYVAYTKVHSVEASWTMSSFAAKQNLPTWVGIGGDGNCQSVVQAGTSHWNRDGQVSYTLWWETYDPTNSKPPVQLNVPALVPGQHLRIKVSIHGETARFDFWIDGRLTSVQTQIAPEGRCSNTADFVVEAVDGPVPFGQLHWSHCRINGKSLGSFQPVPVVLVDSAYTIYTKPLPVLNDSFNLQGW